MALCDLFALNLILAEIQIYFVFYFCHSTSFNSYVLFENLKLLDLAENRKNSYLKSFLNEITTPEACDVYSSKPHAQIVNKEFV